MDTRSEQRAAELFKEALDYADPVERASVLDRACAGDTELRSAVEALLRADASPHKILNVTVPMAPMRERPDDLVGRYKLLKQIGEGGFGVVWMAEQQEPIRRHVALKVIKPGMDTKGVIARFEAERQALALMNHPNVARVFDAGATDDGRPYFVMEYVPGVRITEHCDRYRLTIEERLSLFMNVCEAVQHAHQKGIIHRDLKPSNILVLPAAERGSPEDADAKEQAGTPKVIDFGVAKAIGPPLTERTLLTELGQLIGTPAYMSPEQAEMTAQDIDTRSDVYSLGAVLYELLTGSLPFDPKSLRRAALDEIRRIIRDVDPPKPSTKLSTRLTRRTSLSADERKDQQMAGNGVPEGTPEESAESIAMRRHTEPRALARRLRGDLDWITMKALEKDRSRRYSTALDFAADIQRYLTHEPVIASPPSAAYQASKFMRRHRVAATVVGALAITVVAAVGSFVMYRHQSITRGLLQRAETAEKMTAEALRKARYFNLILSAQSEYEHNIALMKELLQRCPSDLRAWEWYRLLWLSDMSQLTLTGHAAGVTGVAFSPDGALIISGSDDNTVRVWDAGSGEPLRTLTGHTAPVTALAISPDGSLIASGAGIQTIPAPKEQDNTIRVWDASTGRQLRTLRGHDASVSALVFHPDGRRIASGSWDKMVRIWDAVDGVELVTIPAHEYAVTCLAFDPGGTRIVSGTMGRMPVRNVKMSDEDAELKVWDATTGAELAAIPVHGKPVTAVAISSDGMRLLWGSNDGTINEVGLQGTGQLRTIAKHDEAVWSIAFDSLGTRVLSCGSDKTVRLWDGEDGRPLTTLRGHDTYVTSAAFAPDGRRVVSASADRTVKVWDCAGPTSDLAVAAHTGEVTSIAIAPDGTRFVSASGWRPPRRSCPESDKVIQVWDFATGERIMTLAGHQSAISGVGFTADAGNILSISCDAELRQWDASSGECVAAVPLGKGTVFSATFSPDASAVLVVGEMGKLELWDVSGKQPLLGLASDGVPMAATAYSSDGTLVASGGLDRVVSVWRVRDGQRVMKLSGHEDYVMSVAFSADGSRIASGSADKTVRVWDLGTGQPIHTFRGHEGPALALAFSDNGKRLLSGSFDRTIKVWDLEDGVEVMTLPAHDAPISTLRFSADGTRLVVGSHDGTLDLWRLASAREPSTPP